MNGDGNFKMRCVNSVGANSKKYTIGKIYEVIDGHWKPDDGLLIGDSAIKTIEDVNYRSCGVFELVEEEKPLIEIVMERLGVEEGEEFNIIMSDNKGSIYNPFVFKKGELKSNNIDSCEEYLGCLVVGRHTIKKLPWKPKNDEKVWLTYPNNIADWIYFDCSQASNVALYKMGWLFRTKEEAEENRERVKQGMREVMENE